MFPLLKEIQKTKSGCAGDSNEHEGFPFGSVPEALPALTQISMKVLQAVEDKSGCKLFDIIKGPRPRVGEVGGCSEAEIESILVALADDIAAIDPRLLCFWAETIEMLTELEEALIRLGQRAVWHGELHELYRGLRGCLSEDVQTGLSAEQPSEQFRSSVSQLEQIRQLKHEQFLAAQTSKTATAVAQCRSRRCLDALRAPAPSAQPPATASIEIAASRPPPPQIPPPLWLMRQAQTGHGPQGIEWVQDHVADAVGLGKASDLKGWHSQYFAQFSAEFRTMLQREQCDSAFWQSYPWDGLYSCLRNLLMWNYQRCQKKRSSFEDVCRTPTAPGSAAHHFIPCAFWGTGMSKLASCRPLSEGDDAPCAWWPMLVSPWHAPSGWIFGETEAAVADWRWGVCPALAANGGRPWPVHVSRLYVITGHLMPGRGLPAPTRDADANGTDAGASTACADEKKSGGPQGSMSSASTAIDDACSESGGAHSSAPSEWSVL